jgi:hypothetical protein
MLGNLLNINKARLTAGFFISLFINNAYRWLQKK